MEKEVHNSISVLTFTNALRPDKIKTKPLIHEKDVVFENIRVLFNSFLKPGLGRISFWYETALYCPNL